MQGSIDGSAPSKQQKTIGVLEVCKNQWFTPQESRTLEEAESMSKVMEKILWLDRCYTIDGKKCG